MALVNAFGALALDATAAGTTSKVEEVRALLDAVIDEEVTGFEKVRVGTVQGRIASNFAGSAMPQDTFSVAATGTGQTVSLGGAANGARYLNIASGTTINAETIVESSVLVTLPTRVVAQVSASQRIANQECYLELVGVDANGTVQADATGPLNWIALRWDGTTATNAVVITRSGGASVSVSGATGFGTTAATGTSPNFIPAITFDLMAYAERVIASGYAVDALTAAAASLARTTNLPSPLIQYKLRFRVKNLGTAPASSTDFRLHSVRVLDQTRLTAEITGGLGRAADLQGSMPVTGSVNVIGTVPVSGSLTSAGTTTATPATPTASIVNSAATTNATSVKASAGTLYSVVVSNTNAATRYVKFYNLAAAPTVGTSVPALTIAVPTNGTVSVEFGALGMRFGTGIALAITAGAADSDATAVAANDVKVLTSYI